MIRLKDLVVVHGCCKAENPGRNTKELVIDEGRAAAAPLELADERLRLPYYTCALNQIAVREGHDLPLPLDCPSVIASERVEHSDTDYQAWVAAIHVESEDPAVEFWWPAGKWRDVHVYLHHHRRTEVWAEVEELLPGSETYVLLGHSLGSIVAVDLVRTERAHPSALVTVGSPLGIAPVAWSVPLVDVPYPWVNVIDPEDPACLKRGLTPDQRGFGGNPYLNVWVDNPPQDGDHDLIGYLSQPQAVSEISNLLN